MNIQYSGHGYKHIYMYGNNFESVTLSTHVPTDGRLVTVIFHSVCTPTCSKLYYVSKNIHLLVLQYNTNIVMHVYSIHNYYAYIDNVDHVGVSGQGQHTSIQGMELATQSSTVADIMHEYVRTQKKKRIEACVCVCVCTTMKAEYMTPAEVEIGDKEGEGSGARKENKLRPRDFD